METENKVLTHVFESDVVTFFIGNPTAEESEDVIIGELNDFVYGVVREAYPCYGYTGRGI